MRRSRDGHAAEWDLRSACGAEDIVVQDCASAAPCPRARERARTTNSVSKASTKAIGVSQIEFCLGTCVQRRLASTVELSGKQERRGSPWATRGECAGRASAPWLPIGLDHGCAAKTWATAPPLKTVVLTDSMVSGAVKIRSPAPRTTGWMTRRYSSIKPVSTSDRAKRVPPWASRYPSQERCCLSRRDGLGEVSGGDLRLAPVGGCERVREHDLGDLVHRLGEWAGGGGPVAGPFRIGGGTDEVRAGVAHGLDHPTRGVIGASRREPAGAPVE